MMFSKTLNEFGKTGRSFVLSFLEFFLYADVISTNFRFFGKFNRSIELLTIPKKK